MITSNNKLYEYRSKYAGIEEEPGRKDTLFFYDVCKPFKATIVENGKIIEITPINDSTTRMLSVHEIKSINDSDAIFTKEKNISEFQKVQNKIIFIDKEVTSFNKQPNTLKYIDTKPVLQTLTIPLRVRPALGDNVPQEASAGFNVGIAFGWKFNYNIYNPNKDIFSSNINTISISPGLFLGTGVATLDKTNTQPEIDLKRNSALIISGAFFTVGFNKINLGYAIGVDNATGKDGNNWIYDNKIWHGIIFSYDLIK